MTKRVSTIFFQLIFIEENEPKKVVKEDGVKKVKKQHDDIFNCQQQLMKQWTSFTTQTLMCGFMKKAENFYILRVFLSNCCVWLFNKKKSARTKSLEKVWDFFVNEINKIDCWDLSRNKTREIQDAIGQEGLLKKLSKKLFLFWKWFLNVCSILKSHKRN